MNRNITELLKIPETVRIPWFGGVWYKFLSKLDNKTIKKEKLPEHPLNTKEREEKVIVSLTSFPARINCVHLSIKSLMIQTYKPDRIILWLSKLQFKGDEDLPKELLQLKEKGLEIIYCEDDLRGHKKYFEAMKQQQPNELILTYDDDIIYPPNSIKWLMKAHKKYPNAVVANRGYEITFDAEGKIKPNKQWKMISGYGVKKPRSLLHLSNGSGVLYPYDAMYKDVCNKDLIKEYALGIDDLWMTIMAILQGTKMLKSKHYHKIFSLCSGSQEFQLALENIKNEENINKYDVVLEALMNLYPNLREKISITNK